VLSAGAGGRKAGDVYVGNSVTRFVISRSSQEDRARKCLIMVRPERFELPTPCFVGKCSIQLSYGRNFRSFLAALSDTKSSANDYRLEGVSFVGCRLQIDCRQERLHSPCC
jgi:hypothetical protein